MKESHGEGVAIRTGSESCLDDPRGSGEALTGGNTGELKLKAKGNRPVNPFIDPAEATVRAAV
jgi:hypothetical protein